MVLQMMVLQYAFVKPFIIYVTLNLLLDDRDNYSSVRNQYLGFYYFKSCEVVIPTIENDEYPNIGKVNLELSV